MHLKVVILLTLQASYAAPALAGLVFAGEVLMPSN